MRERSVCPPVSRRALLAAAASPFLAAAPSRRPNVIAILADDQGWGDLSVHGNTNLSTPNIDSLARDGALFERFYVCSVCAPTRAEFLTGRYHPRGGVRGVTTGAERLNLDETTVAQLFQAAGYATAAFGKWHNGSQHPYHPNARGFGQFYGFTSGHWGQYFDPELDHNGRLVRGKGFIIDDLTDHSLEFIRQQRSRPFFCYLAYNTPHSPMQVPDRFWTKFAHLDPKMRDRDPRREELPMTRAALAMCENIDWNVGRVLARLEQLKLERDTIVFYFSDNGPNSWRWNGGMKGRKGSVDEGGLRVPFLIRWPGRIRPGSRIPQIAGAIDLLPTLAQLAGVPITSAKPLDGMSLQPLLLGGAKDWPDRMIFSLQRNRVSVRTQQYRLDAEGRLFDMAADPGQDRDVADQKPEVAAKLRRAVAEWTKEMMPHVGPDDRPFPVGHSATTLLPARDGVPEGGIKRSAAPPNCSFFTHWTSQDDRMTWDIEVARGDDYEAAIYYTCRAGDAGSTVELSFLGSPVRGKISEVHDPPLVGAAFDRVPRGESYVKDFRALPLGVIHLDKGRGKLVLRAVEIAGQQVADIRYVSLTRK
ncbi:MAG: arylsulfatase [Acidobacteria bacterium]|nr:arylsulfatase [Acidobacteriota bacterium]